MASDFRVNSNDLDNIFIARTSTKRADVGYSVSNGEGTQGDISNRYEKSAGNGSPNADQINYNTNLKYNGVDLRYYFAGVTTTTTTTTTTPPPTLPTYADFSPWANSPTRPAFGGTYNDGNSLSVTHTGNDGTNPVTLLWYYWNGSTYVSSGQTGTSYNIGSSPYDGTPDNMGGGVFRYYYTLRLTNGAGSTDPQDDTNFGWYVDVQT